MYRWIETEKATYAVITLCRVLGVSTSGYYDWFQRGSSPRSQRDMELKGYIRQIHQDSGGTYGAPRVHAELSLGLGLSCSRKRVARLMRVQGLKGIHRRPEIWHYPPGPPPALLPRSGTAGIHPNSPQPPVGGGPDPASHRRGMALLGRGVGRLLSSSGGMGDGLSAADPANRESGDHGHPEPAAGGWTDSPLGSWCTIYRDSLYHHHRGCWFKGFYGKGRVCPG